jgi:hypothetical protein
MLFPLTSLKSDVARRVSLWERELLTATETVSFLLDRFAFAVEDFPTEWPTVTEALDAVPPILIAGMSGRLAGCRRADGGWHWPPGGMGLANPGPTPPWGTADPEQSLAMELLSRWVQERRKEGGRETAG